MRLASAACEPGIAGARPAGPAARRPVAAGLFVPILLAAARCGAGPPAAAEPAAAPSPAPAAAAEVRVARPEAIPGALQAIDSYPSSLYVERDAKVTARREGIIMSTLVERGEEVTAGQPLALLDSDLAAREVEIADQDLRLAQAEYDRLAPLHQEKIVSAQDFLRAEIARDQAASRAALSRAWLERCTVRAPFDGVVAERWAVPGQRVQLEDDSAYTPLFRIVARGPARARVDLPEALLTSLRIGSRATIETAVDGRRHAARVLFISPTVDPASGTLPVIVEAAQGEGLRPGAAVRVGFPGRAAGAALRLPRAVLPATPGTPGGLIDLLVVEKDRAAARRVRLIEAGAESAIVAGDLRPEDLVIVTPGSGLRAGDPVRVSSVPPAVAVRDRAAP